MPSRFSRLVSIAVAFVLVGHVDAYGETLKKPEAPEALKHLSQGNKLYSVRSFEEAAAEYKAGAMIQSAPIFDYNLGQCYRQLGKYNDAIWHYERFVRASPDTPQHAELAKKFVAQMRAELEQKAKTEPPTDAAPTPAPPPDGPASEPRDIVTAPHDRWYRDAFGWGLAGAGLLGVGVSGVLFIDAASLRDDANMASTQTEADKLHDRADTRALIGTIIGIGGVGILATGVVKLAIHSDATRSQQTSWGVGASPHGAFVWGRF
jgi:tetratricopeptide (TPR) repeat protein